MNDEVRADYQMAGELFGRLEFELGFGYLSMYRDEQDFMFVYRWGFSAKSIPHGCRRVIDIRRQRLISRIPLEMIAQQIADEWKEFHRRASSTESIES